MAYITNIEPSRMAFLHSLHSSDGSQIISVMYDGMQYCLKVFHMKSDFGLTSDGRGLCRYRSETKAYQNLQRYGVCERGYVPRFYGSFQRLDPTHFSPHLDSFLHDEQHPSAILLEYLPNAQQLNYVNYSEECMEKAVAGIDAIYSAYVEHNDTYSKNILIVQGSLERVVWIDFDIAITYQIANLSAGIEKDLQYETEVVKSLGRLLKEDQEQGLPPNTKFY